MKIDSLMLNPGASIYYDQAFRNTLEDHIAYLAAHPNTKGVVLDIYRVHQYEHDLFGLFRFYNVPEELHWLTMRINKITSPQDMPEDLSFILVPDSTIVNRIRTSFMTTKRVQ